MSITDVQSRIQQIQSTIATLGGASVPSGGTAAGAAGFAASLATAQQELPTGSTGASALVSGADQFILPTQQSGSTVGVPAADPVPLQILPASGAGSGSAAVTGGDVVRDAKRYLGVPYVWGGTDPSVGLDCSGLVQHVYSDLGIHLPRVSYQQAQVGQPVASLADARPGDILAFGQPVDHVAIYIGGGRMIAAPEPGDHVKIQDVYTTPTTIRRILPDPVSQAPALRPVALQQAGSADAAQFAGLFTAAEQRYDLPTGLLSAVAKVESGYDPTARSGAGALGLMQIMPSTAAGLGVDPLDPAQAVDGAARLLARNLREFSSVPLALAAYNAGGGAVHRYGGIPPYPETQAYVRKVQDAMGVAV